MSKRFIMASTRHIGTTTHEGEVFFSRTVFHLFHPVGFGA
jgi:hypothetical protein